MHPLLVFLVVVLVGNLIRHLCVLLFQRFHDNLSGFCMWAVFNLCRGWIYLRDSAQSLYNKVKEEASKINKEKVKELTRRHPTLPIENMDQWMEKAHLLYANQAVRIVLQVFFLYSLFLLMSYLRLPYLSYANISPIEATQLDLYEQLQTDILPCVWERNHTEKLCFLQRSDLVHGDTLLQLVERDLVFKELSSRNKSLDFLISEDSSILYPLDFVVPLNQAPQYSLRESAGLLEEWLAPVPPPPDEDSKETTVIRRYVKAETELISLLMNLHAKEASHTPLTQPCICPLFLNIVNNVSFLYETTTDTWTVMTNPIIYRNNSFAELVASVITYSPLSLFAAKHKRWQALAPMILVHYDSFVVEYTEPASSSFAEPLIEQSAKEAAHYQEKLKEASFVKAGVFHRTQEAEIVRKQVHLSGNNAVCFVYCNTLTRGYTTQTDKQIT